MSLSQNARNVIAYISWHLAKQRGPSINENQQCSYRAEDGRMCAVGCLLPSDLDICLIEGAAVTSVLVVGQAVPSCGEEHDKYVVPARRALLALFDYNKEEAKHVLREAQNFHDGAEIGNCDSLCDYRTLLRLSGDEISTYDLARRVENNIHRRLGFLGVFS